MISSIRNSSRSNNPSLEIVKDKNKKLIIERLYKGNSLKSSQLKFNHPQDCIEHQYSTVKVNTFNRNNSHRLLDNLPMSQQKDNIFRFFQQFDNKFKVKYAPTHKKQNNQNSKLHRSLLKQLYQLTNYTKKQTKQQYTVFQQDRSNTQISNHQKYQLNQFLLQTAYFQQPQLNQGPFNKFKIKNEIPQMNQAQHYQNPNFNSRINHFGLIKRSKTQVSIVDKQNQRSNIYFGQIQENKHKRHSIRLFNIKKNQNNDRQSISEYKNAVTISNRDGQDRIYRHSNSYRYLKQLSRFKTEAGGRQQRIALDMQKDKQNLGYYMSNRIKSNRESSSQKLKLIRKQLHQIYSNRENQNCQKQDQNYNKNNYLQINKVNKGNQNFNYSHRLLLNRSNNYHHPR